MIELNLAYSDSAEASLTGFTQIGIAQIGPTQIGLAKVGFTEVGAIEVSSTQIGTREIHTRQGGVPEVPSLSIVGETPANQEIVRVEKELSP